MFGVYQLNSDLKWEQMEFFDDEITANHFKKMEMRRNNNPLRVFTLDETLKPKGIDCEELVI